MTDRELIIAELRKSGLDDVAIEALGDVTAELVRALEEVWLPTQADNAALDGWLADVQAAHPERQ